MATASVEMDLALGDNTKIANQICLLVTTCGDGTPLGPTPFGEEDTIKVCIGLGQEHPEGVLQLLDTEMVLAFPSDSNLMAALHWFVMAMLWCGEPVKLCIWPLTSAQVRYNISARSSHPSGMQTPAQGGEVEISEPHPDNGPQMELTRDLWDFDDV